MFVIGKRDMEANAVSVRVHGRGNLGAKPRGEAIADVQLWDTGKTHDSLVTQIRAGTGKKRELGTDAAGNKSAGTTEEGKGEYLRAQFNSVAFSSDGSKVITSTSLWLHIFQLRSEAPPAIASCLKPSPSFTAPFVEPSGSSVRIVTGVAEGKLAIKTFDADLPTADPITGTSETLLRDWQRRLALQFTADGKIVPAP